MSEQRSDVLVLFGATGDLAHKKIFPALYSMVKRGSLTEPVVGIAYDDWTVEQLVERAHDGIEGALGKVDEAVFKKLAGLLRYVSGDYRSQETFDKLKEALDGYREAMACHLGDVTEYLDLQSRLTAAERVAAVAGSARRRRAAAEDLARLRRGDVIHVPTGRRSGLAVVLDPGIDPDGVARPLVATEGRWAGRLSVADFRGPVPVLGRLKLGKVTEHRVPKVRRDLASALASSGIAPPPRRILAISFKRDAATNLAARVRQRCHRSHAGRLDSMTFDAFAKSLVDRFGQALPERWRPRPDYELMFPNDTAFRGFLFQDVGTPPKAIGSYADLQAISIKTFERSLLVGSPLPVLGWPDPTVGQWAADRFWQSSLHEGKKTFLSFPMIGRLAELLLRVNPMARDALRLTYSHLFMDEFQAMLAM